MNMKALMPPRPEIVYPECDGELMADNTLQFEWIVTIKGGLDVQYRDDEQVFVAGDLLWYPVEGNNKICTAPDVFVVFGRPKGYRGSYLQWREGGIAPQVVFEMHSPSNRKADLVRKFQFYEDYGVEEYYHYDPETNVLSGWLRSGNKLVEIPNMNGWKSRRLGIQFVLTADQLQIIGPDGKLFPTFVELSVQRDQEERAKEKERLEKEKEREAQEKERQEKERERQEKEKERLEAAKERERAERLAAQLRALGVEPEV